MELQAIAILPTRNDLNERLERDLILELIKMKPQTFIFVDPKGCSGINELGIEYDTRLNINGHKYTCDMGFLDDLHKVLYRDEIPNLFVSPEVTDLYRLSFKREPYFINFINLLDRVYPDYKIAVISPGSLNDIDELEAGRSIRESIERAQSKSVLIVFSDLIENPDFKNQIKSSIESNDFLPIFDTNVLPDEQADYYSLLEAIGATDSLLIEPKILENNDELCYFLKFVVQSINIKEKDHPEFTTDSIIQEIKNKISQEQKILKEQENVLQKMVRETLRLWITQRKRLDFSTYAELEIGKPEIIERLKLQRTGVFVTILENGQYRGSMGTVTAVYNNIGEEIINNAIEAAFFDPDRIPMTLEELDQCLFEVDVLNPLESVEELSELDPKKYGIVVEQGFKRGVVLPNIKGINTVEDQLSLAKNRAGIIEELDTFEPLSISRFSVETF